MVRHEGALMQSTGGSSFPPLKKGVEAVPDRLHPLVLFFPQAGRASRLAFLPF